MAAAIRAENAAIHQPYSNAKTGTWWVWSTETGQYEDTGEVTKGDTGPVGPQGPQGPAGPAGKDGTGVISVKDYGATGDGVNTSDATATAGDILAGLTAYVADGKVTGTLKMSQGTITLQKTVTNVIYETITHNLGTVPSLIFLWVENKPTFDSTTTYNIVCGYAVNFASGLVPGVRANKSAAQCINSSGNGAGDTTVTTATTCVADQITASSFRLRTNGNSRCWANGSQIRWIALA